MLLRSIVLNTVNDKQAMHLLKQVVAVPHKECHQFDVKPRSNWWRKPCCTYDRLIPAEVKLSSDCQESSSKSLITIVYHDYYGLQEYALYEGDTLYFSGGNTVIIRGKCILPNKSIIVKKMTRMLSPTEVRESPYLATKIILDYVDAWLNTGAIFGDTIIGNNLRVTKQDIKSMDLLKDRLSERQVVIKEIKGTYWGFIIRPSNKLLLNAKVSD